MDLQFKMGVDFLSIMITERMVVVFIYTGQQPKFIIAL